MKMNMNKEIKYLEVYFGGCPYPEDIMFFDDIESYDTFDSIFSNYPELKAPQNKYSKELNNQMYIKIDVDTGQILNWPIGLAADLNCLKVVDEGTYILLDSKDNKVSYHDYRYVPQCLQIDDNGFGDYFMFRVNKEGYIVNWKFGKNEYNELIS